VKTKSSRPAGRADVTVKKGFKTTEQIGIAVACLVEEENKLLIDWVVDVSGFIIVCVGKTDWVYAGIKAS
jgi:hypothetical protein